MEKENSTFIEKVRGFSKILHQRTLFRTIGITYQVFWNLFLIFLVLLCMVIFFIGGAGAGYFVSLVKDEPLLSEEEMRTAIYDYEETSQVFFANDVFLGELPSDIERHEVSLEDVSEYVIQAIIATEDEYFYEHDGIVPKAIMRAILQEVANSSLQTGGSTLTQQLIKNQILTNEVSFDRKATEMLLAMRLETYLNKEEILEAYLNIVPFGRNASGRQIAGIQAAAQGIFGVDASELSIPQAAYIAGLPQSPFGYTPFRNDGSLKENIEPSLNRMSIVLSRMYEAGYITEEERNEALKYDIEANFASSTPAPIEEYPYLTYEVLRRAVDVLSKQRMEEDGVDLSEMDREEQLETRQRYNELISRELRVNGYRIHTTVDKDIYFAMQESIQNDSLFGPNKEGKPEQIGAVLLENRTGAIKGFVGGRTEGSDDHYNRATQAYRHNASTMKPLIAYAPALEIGAVQPGIVIPDTEDQYSNGQPIRNFDHQHIGLLSVRESLARSRNVPAIRAYRMVGFERARQTLLNLGFVLPDDAPYESSPLGTHEVSVEQNTNAFATFANGGTYVESYMIERIETADGELVYEHQPETREVFTPQTSYLIIDMMRDVLRGVGTASSLPGRLSFSADWAGKTGTSNDDRDSWFVALNPNVTMGVWIGYDDQHVIEGRSGPKTQQIWANLANAAYSINPDLLAPSERFEVPDGIVSRSICSLTGLLPSKACQEAGFVTTDLFNAKFLPSEEDGSLESTRYVTINGKNFVALDSTPTEFTKEGVKLSEGFWNMDMSRYLPDSMRNIVLDQEAPNNGRVPRDVENVRINDGELRWSLHSDNDIIGYRIYRAKNGTTDYEPIANVVGNETTSYSISGKSNSYYVTAIDTAGRESARSNIAEGDDYVPEVTEEEDDAEESEVEEEVNESSSNEQQNNNANDNANENRNNNNASENRNNDNASENRSNNQRSEENEQSDD